MDPGDDGSRVEHVSIVIPMYNASATIEAQLSSLAACDPRPREVIVVDNNSTDDSARRARGFADRFETFRVVDCDRQSANAARNTGVAATTGEYVLFLDADDRVPPAWFAQHLSALPWDAVAGGLQDCHVRESGDWVPIGGPRSAVFDHSFLPDVCTASAGVRRGVWEELSGFDERFSQGGDDTEFFWRVMLAGYEVKRLPEAVVCYRTRKGLVGVWRQRWYHGVADARLHRQFHVHGWDDHFRLRHLWNLLPATRSLVLRRIGPREWFARIAVVSGALFEATFGREDRA